MDEASQHSQVRGRAAAFLFGPPCTSVRIIAGADQQRSKPSLTAYAREDLHSFIARVDRRVPHPGQGFGGAAARGAVNR